MLSCCLISYSLCLQGGIKCFKILTFAWTGAGQILKCVRSLEQQQLRKKTPQWFSVGSCWCITCRLNYVIENSFKLYQYWSETMAYCHHAPRWTVKPPHRRANFPWQVSCQVYFLVCTTNNFFDQFFPWPVLLRACMLPTRPNTSCISTI
jgi:hypothetical protein